MKSVFAQTASLPKVDTIPKKIEMQLFLTHTHNEILNRSLFRLSIPYLLQLSSSSEVVKILDLSTTIFEPFSDQHPNKVQHGFTLNGEEYWVDTEEDLENFYNHVTKTCILTSVESQFVFIKKIGSGSTSKVYLAQDLEKSHRYAVKCVKKSYLTKPQSLQNLLTEIKTLRSIDHTNICKLQYVFEDESQVCLFFDYFSETTLYKVLSKKVKFEEAETRKFLMDLLQTLKFLHKQNIVHRDIKLENILITNEVSLEFKLIDFGLAFNSRDLQVKKCGTPGYIAPEILKNERYGPKVDVFSAGVTAFAVLHGYLPFDGNNVESILSKTVECEVKIDKKLSKNLRNVLIDMMQPVPEKRPSASELLWYSWFKVRKEAFGSLSSTISQ